ncbi:MAG: hypothetical protein ACYCVD_07335 [Desulfitobacteriaceae bacterium]
MRRGRLGFLQRILQQGERLLIRVMILASVALVIVQMGLAKDPVAFYLAMAERVEYPPLNMPALALEDTKATYTLGLRAIPNAPVKVWQNDKLIADLSQGEQQIAVQKGQILLDGRGISQAIRVQVIKKDNALKEPRLNQTLILQGNIQGLLVTP